MPIELKWVRQDPKQVEDWQRLRLARDDDDGTTAESLVQDVLQKDETSRRYLLRLQQEKSRRKQLQQKLRPDKSDGMDDDSSSRRKELLAQKKAIDHEISQLEIFWKASLKETEHALSKLASPVGLVVQAVVVHADNVQLLNIADPEQAPSSTWNHDVADDAVVAGTRRVLDLEQAFYRYTIHHFGRYTSSINLPSSGLPVVGQTTMSQGKKAKYGSVSPDRAHALWGCLDSNSDGKGGSLNSIGADLDVDNEKDCTACVPACPICRVGVSGAQPPLTVLLPTWIRLLVEYLPAKSIWGDRQLPAYTALWSKDFQCPSGQSDQTQQTDVFSLGDTTNSNLNPTAASSSLFSFQLVALTAPSMVDAGEIQSDLVHDLISYYEGLIIPKTSHGSTSSMASSRLSLRQVPPSQLHPHEWSRVEIHIERVIIDEGNGKTDPVASSGDDSSSGCSQPRYCLGSVSHWGDAASRACDMAFSGGGGVNNREATIKEYVHIVQASVVDQSTWNKILHANRRLSSIDGEVMVGLSPSIACHLMDPVQLLQTTETTPAVVVATEKEAEKVVWLALKDLEVEDMSIMRKNRKQTIFGSLEKKSHPLRQPQLHQNRAANPTMRQAKLGASTLPSASEPKFPPLPHMTQPEQKRDQSIIKGEALSCPFNFLFL